MSLRLKLVLSFTLLCSALLALSVYVIYYLYNNNRIAELRLRLWAQAYHDYTEYYHTSIPNAAVRKEVENYYPYRLPDADIFIVNRQGKITELGKSSFQPQFTLSLFNKIKNTKKSFYSFSMQGKECVGFYVGYAPYPAYVIACSTDVYGANRMRQLQWIIIIVTIISIVLISLLSLWYATILIKPLKDLEQQMQKISETNLNERLPITKQKKYIGEPNKIASQFNAMLDRLQKAFELQKSFVHHASHELRTPLSTMLAQTEAALNKASSETELKNVLLSLKEDQQAMIELTNSLLLISQYENINNTTSRWTPFRIDELLYDVFASAKKMYSNIHISFQLLEAPEQEEDFIISGNETLLKSAFLNLIKNAYTYSKNQTITVSLQIKKDSLFLYFDNNGPLLSTQEQERLFIPFFRGLNAQHKKGFGLGLSIVSRILFLHQGTVSYTVYNQLNRFAVQLPKT